jgi:glycine cleavage system H protein
MNKEKFPNNLKYNQDYSWIKIKQNIAVIGIIENAAKKIDEFIFINLPQKGKKIKQNDNYVSLEAIKWSGHLSSPVSGEIIEVNDSLFNEPSKINKTPFESWIIKVKLNNKDEIENLMDSKQAKKYYEENTK